MMKIFFVRCAALLLVLSIMLTASVSLAESLQSAASQTQGQPLSASEPIYMSERAAGEMPDIDVKVLYLTVKKGSTENTNHTWAEINTYSAADYEKMGVDRYLVEGVLREGTEEGALDSAGLNCTVSFRGQSSSSSKQKSYKIKLTDGKWMDQKVLNLNKHYSDKTRFLNKLAYDLIDEVPQLIGLKTQFVHLYVKDLSEDADPDTAEYVDYGLFTHVEQLNNRARKRMGLAEECSLYKVNIFEFWEYNDIRLTTDPLYNEKKFENRLENKGTTDNDKIISLMDLVNKGEISDQELLDCYVEKENIAYWMAFHILLDNQDTNCRNFYLYSPVISEKWYIISWDNDGAFARIRAEIYNNKPVPWRFGVHNYWGTRLFRNLLRTKDFRDAVLNAAADLKEHYMTAEHVRALLDCYMEKTGYILSGKADSKSFRLELYEKIAERIPDEIEKNYDRLVDSFNYPTPYFIGKPVYNEDTKEVSVPWDESYDFEGRSVSYLVEVSQEPDFETVLYSEMFDGTRAVFTHTWGPGKFFVRVSAINEDGYMMSAFSSTWVDGFGSVYSAESYSIAEP